MTNFERVTIADLEPGDHIIFHARLIEYGGESLGFRPQARVSRLLPGIDPNTVRVQGPNETRHYLGVTELAEELGVSRATITKWIARYPAEIGLHPTPKPDVRVGGVAGWKPGRVREWQTWRADMPGRGAGGGRPRKTAADRLTEARVAEIDRFEDDRNAEEEAEEARRLG